MRFKLVFSIDRDKSPLPVLPLNYQYPLSCWIYRVIRKGHPDFTGWLLKNGFSSPRQVFNLFTFSNLKPGNGEFEVNNDRLMILADKVEMVFSCISDPMTVSYITNLFNRQQFSIGDKKSRVFFKVIKVINLPDVDFEGKARFTTLSPVVVSRAKEDSEDEKTEYLRPEDEEFKTSLLYNLYEKVYSKVSKEIIESGILVNEQALRITSEIQETPIIIKSGTNDEATVSGYEFDFEIEAPGKHIQAGYYGGFGDLNSMGFGCVEVIKEDDFY